MPLFEMYVFRLQIYQDAMHKSPNFSAAYVVISVQGLKVQGHGLTFTEGRGTEIVVSAIQALLPLLLA